MKKTLLLSSLMSLAMFAAAQTSGKVSIKAGVNFSSLAESSGDQTIITSGAFGFHVGVVDDFNLGSVSIQPGLFYSNKGGKYDQNGTNNSGITTYTYHHVGHTNLNFVEVPVNILYNLHANGEHNFFFGGGPYTALGTSGRYSESIVTTNTTGSKTSTVTTEGSGIITFGHTNNDLKNFDFGVNLLGGVQFESGLLLSAGYGIGLVNLSNAMDTSTKNKGFSFSVGYSF